MPSANISFDTIPSTIRTPGVYSEFNTKMAVATLPANLYKCVIVGQRIAAGSVAANVLTDVFSAEDAANYFGRGSIAHLMVKAAIKANNYLSLQAIAADDAAASVAASGTVTITGPATAPGALNLGVNGQSAAIAFASGDTANSIAAALQAQIAAQPDLPVTAAVLGAVVTLTAKNKGTLGNAIKLTATPTANTGVAAAVVAMANGATDPDITNTLAAIFTAGHNIVITAFNDATNLGKLATHINNVSAATEKRRARGVFSSIGTYAQATTLSTGVNNGRILQALVPSANEAEYEVAAAMASIAASEEDPARPLNGMILVGLTVPPIASWLSGSQVEAAVHNGVTPVRCTSDGDVHIVRAVTTYLTNVNAVPDISLMDWTTIGALDYVAKSLEDTIALKFPRDKKSARTKARLQDAIYDVMLKLQELEIVENVQATDILIQDDLADPTRYDVRIMVNVVNGLHVIAQRLDLIL
jgi:phage tail sheath gpL-like